MPDAKLRDLVQKHGPDEFVSAVNEEIARCAAPVDPMTSRILRDLIYRGFRPVYGVWILAALRSKFGYSTAGAVEAFPELAPFAAAAAEIGA